MLSAQIYTYILTPIKTMSVVLKKHNMQNVTHDIAHYSNIIQLSSNISVLLIHLPLLETYHFAIHVFMCVCII